MNSPGLKWLGVACLGAALLLVIVVLPQIGVIALSFAPGLLVLGITLWWAMRVLRLLEAIHAELRQLNGERTDQV